MSSVAARITIDGQNAESDQSGMDIVSVPDNGGNAIKFQIFEGKYYVPYHRPADLQAIKTFELHPDDIYFCAYPRTGTNWTFEMICMLLSGEAKTIGKSKVRNQLEFASRTDHGALPRPRVLNTHMRFSDGPEQLRKKKCKVIYNLRDPKDVSVSLYHLYKDFSSVSEYYGEFKDFLYLFLDEKVECSGMFGHLLDAEKFFRNNPDIPVHIQVYEETSKNTLLEVQELSDFLGLRRNDDLCQAIADKCKFSKMRVDKDKYTIKQDDTNPLYRKGIVGDWKNWFTDQMLEDYYRVYEEKMAGSRFYQRYARI